MRLNLKPKPSRNEYREITIFLILPRTIQNEFRWLEKATIRQCYREDSYFNKKWRDMYWIDKDVGSLLK